MYYRVHQSGASLSEVNGTIHSHEVKQRSPGVIPDPHPLSHDLSFSSLPLFFSFHYNFHSSIAFPLSHYLFFLDAGPPTSLCSLVSFPTAFPTTSFSFSSSSLFSSSSPSCLPRIYHPVLLSSSLYSPPAFSHCSSLFIYIFRV